MEVKNSGGSTYAGKVTVMSLADLDGRTNAARRAKEVIGELEREYGSSEDLPVEQRMRIVDLAILNAMSEDLAVKFFLGEPVDRIEFATLVNAKRRALDSL
jgi:hypothetical protein